jgi:hypothetical protein
MTITDSNTTFTGMISSASLAAVMDSISALNTAVVSEWDLTSGDSGSAMIQDGGQWRVKGERESDRPIPKVDGTEQVPVTTLIFTLPPATPTRHS